MNLETQMYIKERIETLKESRISWFIQEIDKVRKKKCEEIQQEVNNFIQEYETLLGQELFTSSKIDISEKGSFFTISCKKQFKFNYFSGLQEKVDRIKHEKNKEIYDLEKSLGDFKKEIRNVLDKVMLSSITEKEAHNYIIGLELINAFVKDA